MSREAWGTPPDIEPEHCPLCGETSHVDGCEVGALQAKHNAEVSRLQQRISALEKDAARWRYVHDEPESARHLIRLLLDGKGTPGDLDKMVDRIIASKRAALAAEKKGGA